MHYNRQRQGSTVGHREPGAGLKSKENSPVTASWQPDCEAKGALPWFQNTGSCTTKLQNTKISPEIPSTQIPRQNPDAAHKSFESSGEWNLTKTTAKP